MRMTFDVAARARPRRIAVPLSLTVGSSAVDALRETLGEIGLEGLRLLVVSGAGPSRDFGDRVHRRLGNSADRYLVRGNSRDDVVELDMHCARRDVEGLIAVGGGKVIDVCKMVAGERGLSVLVVPTALSSDGIASPVAVIVARARSLSLPAQMPIGVLIDLDFVRGCPDRLLLSGFGDLVANLSATLDWALAVREGKDSWDGFADILARQAAEQVLFLQPSKLLGQDGIVRLAEGLVMSGIAMAVAGSSRPCSGAEHLISHALDALRLGSGMHGEQVAIGLLFVQALRQRMGLPGIAEEAVRLVRESGLPSSPGAIGVSRTDFLQALEYAPETRPGRFTVLSLSSDELFERAFADAFPEG